MKKEYIITPEYVLTANEIGKYSNVGLSVAAAVALGAKIKKVLNSGDVLLEMNEGNLFLATDTVEHSEIAQRCRDHEANWFNPILSKPIAQELLRRFPMVLNPVVFRYGALAAEWLAESNTQFAAGIPSMAGLLSGKDAWVMTTSENALEAITLNALMQWGVERHAVFYFPNGEKSAELIYLTTDGLQVLSKDRQMQTICVQCPALDKYSIVGVPPEEFRFELEAAVLTLQIQVARWMKETGKPAPFISAPTEEEEEAADAPAEPEETSENSTN